MQKCDTLTGQSKRYGTQVTIKACRPLVITSGSIVLTSIRIPKNIQGSRSLYLNFVLKELERMEF